MSAIEKQFEEWLKEQRKKNGAGLKGSTVNEYVRELKLERIGGGSEILYKTVVDIIGKKLGAKSFYQVRKIEDYKKVRHDVMEALETLKKNNSNFGHFNLRSALKRYEEFLKERSDQP